MKFQLGIGVIPLFIVTLGFLALGGFFAYAGVANLTEPLVIFDREILGPEYVRYGFFIAALWMGGAGVFCLVQSVRKAGKEKFVLLDANRLVTSGLGLSGEETSVPYRDIVRLRDYKVRGMPVLEIEARDGTRITLPNVLFREKDAFLTFRQELGARYEHLDPQRMFDHAR